MAGIQSLLAGAGRLALGAGKEIGKGMLSNAAGGLTGDALNMLLPTMRSSSGFQPLAFPPRAGHDVVPNEDNVK